MFLCGKWLSLNSDDGLTLQTLYIIGEDLIETETMFSEVSTHYMFDDNLWFSLQTRPSFSRFTRVQRLWLLVAILFLSMVTSAMFFRSSEGTSRSISLGPVRLNYKQFYVGFMSFMMAIIPSMIIMYIFKYRKCKNEVTKSQGKKHQRKKEPGLPWWTVFIAYGLIVASVTSGAFFTFLYSLEWGPDVTVDWMMSFVIGLIQSVFILEPCKVCSWCALYIDTN